MFRTTSSSIPMTAPCTSWRTVLIANSRGAASRTTRNAPRRSPGSRRQLLYSVGTSDAGRPMMITPSVIIAPRAGDLVGTPHEPAALVPQARRCGERELRRLAGCRPWCVPVRGLSPDRARPRAEETHPEQGAGKEQSAQPPARDAVPGPGWHPLPAAAWRLHARAQLARRCCGLDPARIHAGRPEPGPGPKGLCVLRSLPDRPGRKCSGAADPRRQPDRRAQSLGLLSAAVVRWRALLQLRPEGQVQLLRRGLRSLVDADDGRHRSGPAVDPT